MSKQNYDFRHHLGYFRAFKHVMGCSVARVSNIFSAAAELQEVHGAEEAPGVGPQKSVKNMRNGQKSSISGRTGFWSHFGPRIPDFRKPAAMSKQNYGLRDHLGCFRAFKHVLGCSVARVSNVFGAGAELAKLHGTKGVPRIALRN